MEARDLTLVKWPQCDTYCGWHLPGFTLSLMDDEDGEHLLEINGRRLNCAIHDHELMPQIRLYQPENDPMQCRWLKKVWPQTFEAGENFVSLQSPLLKVSRRSIPLPENDIVPSLRVAPDSALMDAHSHILATMVKALAEAITPHFLRLFNYPEDMASWSIEDRWKIAANIIETHPANVRIADLDFRRLLRNPGWLSSQESFMKALSFFGYERNWDQEIPEIMSP